MTRKQQHRSTLSEVAAAAGVSKAAASYALTGRGDIAEETRRRILSVAEDLGYLPNLAAREVALGRSATINVVLSSTVNEPGAGNYYVTELLAGVEEIVRASEFQLQFSVWEGAAPQNVTAGSAGLLYLGGSFPTTLDTIAIAPAVLIGTFFSRWPYDAVSADNRRGAYLALSHLLGANRRRVAFINGPARTRTSEIKMLGYQEALEEHSIQFEPALVREGDFTVTDGYECTRQLFAESPYPDALFIADDPMAIGALRALGDLGIGVPDDVAVIGYGDSPAALLAHPTLSTVRVFQREMGALGASRLVHRMNEESREYVRILVAPELVVRQSSAS